MSGPIVEQLLKQSIDPDSNLMGLLRLAFFTATDLNQTEFKTWCKYELEGYPADEEVPEYRKITGILQLWNRHYGYTPFIIPDEAVNASYTERELGIPISTIISSLKTDKETLELKLSNSEIIALLNFRKGAMINLDPRLTFYPSQFVTVLDAVRQNVLKWVLEMRAQGIKGEDYTFTPTEKKAAETMSVNNHYNIQNVQGVVGGVSGGTVNQNNQMNVQNGNFDSLASVLRGNNVAESDIQSLKDAIQHDPAPNAPNRYGQGVSGWISSMMGKAASGSWDISLAVAGTLLGDAISKFYGLG